MELWYRNATKVPRMIWHHYTRVPLCCGAELLRYDGTISLLHSGTITLCKKCTMVPWPGYQITMIFKCHATISLWYLFTMVPWYALCQPGFTFTLHHGIILRLLQVRIWSKSKPEKQKKQKLTYFLYSKLVFRRIGTARWHLAVAKPCHGTMLLQMQWSFMESAQEIRHGRNWHS